jgi:hypothetical protein
MTNLGPSSTKPDASGPATPSGPKAPTWEEIANPPEPRLSFNPSGSYVNNPVKGELNVQIDPEDLKKIPETINVYKILPMFKSEEELKEMAARFGMYGECSEMAIEKGDKRIGYSWKMDCFYFNDDEEGSAPGAPIDVPSKEESKKIAWKIAQEKDLLCPEAEIIATNVTQGAGDATDNQLVPEQRTVVIGRNVDGYRVRGPGMELRIKLGNKGALCYVTDYLRKLELYGTYKIKPLEQALDEARKGIGSMNLMSNSKEDTEPENPTVKDMAIFYYAELSYRENRALIPVYAFMGGDCSICVPAFGERIGP